MMVNQQSTKRLIVIAGPTAVGKTAFAIKVAEFFNTEIISCDSRQLYRELNIGVARPSLSELAAVPHHFIGNKSIHQDYNAGMYAEDVDQLLNQLFTKHDTVVMTGGTGLYIKAAIEGLDVPTVNNPQLRQQLTYILNAEGLEALQAIAESAGITRTDVDYNNPQRLMRAIEIKTSDVSEKEVKPKEPTYEVSYYFLNRNREELYQRINKRVDMMLKDGFEKEARGLFQYKGINALNTVGYKDFFKYFEGEWTLEHAVDKMKQHTRNYAKRQLTWFRNQGNYKEITPDIDLFLNILKLDK